MEQSENIERLLEMLDDPEKFSDSEIRKAMESELYRQLVELKRAENCPKDIDTDEAWKRFENTKLNAPKTLKINRSKFLRAAAVLTAAVLMGGLSYATIQHFSASKQTDTEQVAVVEKPSTEKKVKNDDGTVVAEPIVFDNVPLEKILDKISKHYGNELVFNNKSAKKIRLYLQWNPDEPIENVIEKLNMFERFKVKRDGQKIVVE